MRKFLTSLLITLLMVVPLAGPVGADSYPTGRVLATIVRNFDPTNAAYVYMALGDNNAVAAPINNDGVSGALGPGSQSNKKATSAGATTTLTSLGSVEAFRGRAVNDLLIFRTSSRGATTLGQLIEDERNIVTFTNSNTVVVDSNIDLTDSYTFNYKRFVSGTAATDAWINVQGFDAMTFQADVNTINATSLDWQLQCRVSKFAAPFQVQTDNFTAVGSKVAKLSRGADADYEQCRVGWKINTDTGVNSVSVYFLGIK